MKFPCALRVAAPFRKNAGMALVVCLALIVLITAAVLAFFARATSNRVVESSRANRVEVEQLAKTAGDYIISSFLRETSTPPNATNAVPQRPLPAALASDANFVNLIRRSVNEATNGVGETNASGHSTATASANGRKVGTNRWNAPVLLSGGGFTDDAQLPNWIYIDADGTATRTASTNAIGRFAYNVYDVGGLLDANVAGYPSSWISAGTTNMAILKGTLAGADLSAIAADADAFVNWRNAGSATSADAYVAAVTNAAANGFLVATGGDNRITGRQDLIKLAGAGYLPTNALPYLTYFTRELARPSLTNNGLTNMAGRYALSQLATLAKTGLTGSNSDLTYAGVLAANISTNAPDFFQVLRAGIAYTNAWETNGATGVFSPPGWTTNLDLKAVAVGANVIDQFVTGAKQPTRILLDADRVAGKKPFPMVMQVFLAYSIDAATTNLCFSVIPQVWSPAVPANTTLTAALTGGQITVDGVPLPSGSFSSATETLNNPTSSGAAAVTNGNAIPALSGFFAKTVPLTNATPTNLTVTLTGLSLISRPSGSTNAYSAFGTNAANSALVSASLSLTNATLINPTPPAYPNGLAGIAILTSDPRTLRGAGQTNAFSTNAIALLSAPLPTGTSTNYGGGITETTIASPTDRISSVGELGRVFRESPWRTVDFVTANSPDKALLDVFSAYATPTNAAGLPVRAGVVNLNTRQPLVLAALLSGMAKNADNTQPLSMADATTIADQMVAATTAAALTNRSQLVDLVANGKLTVAAGGEKGVRETAIRALAEVGQTRTWNLMIDLVAQTGTFPATPGASSFRVQGERRLWIHTAIDRPTRRVISQSTEACLE